MERIELISVDEVLKDVNSLKNKGAMDAKIIKELKYQPADSITSIINKFF